MKTYEIKDLLNKEVLVIEMPEGSYPEITSRLLAINHSDGSIKIFKGSFTLLGSPDEIKEDDVNGLVHQSIHTDLFAHYVSDIPVNTYYYKTALESFNSALESEIYWNVNPISKELGFIGNVSEIDKQIALQKQKRRFTKAQEKTFDRKRSIILFKN